MTAKVVGRTYSVDEILASSWDRKPARDLASEIDACTGERRKTVEEIRRFLALKGYRELLHRLRAAREGRSAEEALAAVALAMRRYALLRQDKIDRCHSRRHHDCPGAPSSLASVSARMSRFGLAVRVYS